MKFDIQNILQQAQKVQEEMENIKNSLANKYVTAESGGGMVTAVMSGNNRLKSLKFAPELLAANDITMLEDLVVAAVNKALDKASEMTKEEMGKVKNMLPNVPGLNLNL
jgi:DNA-binding YbaB/EbfC family protein